MCVSLTVTTQTSSSRFGVCSSLFSLCWTSGSNGVPLWVQRPEPALNTMVEGRSNVCACLWLSVCVTDGADAGAAVGVWGGPGGLSGPETEPSAAAAAVQQRAGAAVEDLPETARQPPRRTQPATGTDVSFCSAATGLLIVQFLGDLGRSVKPSQRNLVLCLTKTWVHHCKQLTKNCFYQLRKISEL